MHRTSAVSFILAIVLTTVAPGQESHIPAPTGPDSASHDSVPDGTAVPEAPPLPTPEQDRYLDGLRRVGRGIAQLKTALDRVSRSEASRDTVSQRRATRRLGGYCGSARWFMTGGRARMNDTAYADTTGLRAKRLTRAIDDLIQYAPTCETDAGSATKTVVRELGTRLRAYDDALADFRAALGLPTARDG